MTINVIKPATAVTHRVTCECGAELEYEETDLIGLYSGMDAQFAGYGFKCPGCNRTVEHEGQLGPKAVQHIRSKDHG